MAAHFVQQTGIQITSGASSVAATLNGVANGNFLFAGVFQDGLIPAHSVTSVVDGASNAFTATPATPIASADNSSKFWIYYRPAVQSGNITVTVTFDVAITLPERAFLWMLEFSGVQKASPFDVEGVAEVASGATNITTPSVTSTADGDVFISLANGFGGSGSTISAAGSGWTLGTVMVTSRADEWFIQTRAGAKAVNYVQTGDGYFCVSACFKAAAYTAYEGSLTRPRPFAPGIAR